MQRQVASPKLEKDDATVELSAARRVVSGSMDSPVLGSVGKDPSPDLPKIVTFEALARCGDEVWIEHAGMLYRLRKTRQGKLILTK